MVEYLLTELCPNDSSTALLTPWYVDACVALSSTASSTYGFLTYSVVCVGVLLHGLGSGLLITTGFIYVDENALNKAVPVYFGESSQSVNQLRIVRQHRMHQMQTTATDDQSVCHSVLFTDLRGFCANTAELIEVLLGEELMETQGKLCSIGIPITVMDSMWPSPDYLLRHTFVMLLSFKPDVHVSQWGSVLVLKVNKKPK